MKADIISQKEVADVVCCCANCGVAAVDEFKLKPRPHCDLFHYCSEKYQQDHRDLHEAMCSQRAAELYDEILFKQPESNHLGDCPLCFLPLPLDTNKRSFRNCCGKLTCKGCFLATALCEIERGVEEKCPFCRMITPTTDEEDTKRLSRRAEANDPIALQNIGSIHYNEEDYENAFRYFTRAAEAGCEEARFQLGSMYMQGKFVERNVAKCVYKWEQAAIGGHVSARYGLGGLEWNNDRYDRAVKHWIISANLGDDASIEWLTKCYKEGHVSKDDFARALRANQAAVDAMKSPQREAAEIYFQAQDKDEGIFSSR